MINSIPSPRQLTFQLPLLSALLSLGLASNINNNAIPNIQNHKLSHALQDQAQNQAPFIPESQSQSQSQSQSHPDSYSHPQIITNQACPPPSLSCPSSNPNPVDECCLESPNSGHFLSTQFWDTSPSLGPVDSWTLHGLWPDHCTGGFDQYCDNTRTKSPRDLERILGLAGEIEIGTGRGTEAGSYDDGDGQDENEGRKGLLQFMRKYWLSMDHRDSNLWAHEWNKHGTCISTLKPECYDYGRGLKPSSSGFLSEDDDDDDDHHQITSSEGGARSSPNEMKDYEDILDYFVQATVLFAHLDTYSFLERAGIVPSHDQTYKLSDIETAIKTSFAQSMSSSSSITTTKTTTMTEIEIEERGAKNKESVPARVPEIGTTLRCNRNHELQEVWYHFLIRGPLRHARANFTSPRDDPAVNPIMKTFMPTEADGQVSNCPPEGVKYIPKSGGSPEPPPPHTTTTATTSSKDHARPTPTSPFTGRGHLKVRVISAGDEQQQQQQGRNKDDYYSALGSSDDRFHGCFIRAGMWYASGACAAYTARTDVAGLDDDKNDHLFTLDSSYAPCAILKLDDSHRHGGVHGEDGQFVCARRLPVQTVFGSAPSSEEDESDEKDSVLSYQNRTVFYADRSPGRFEKIPVFANDDDGKRGVQIEVHWEGL